MNDVIRFLKGWRKRHFNIDDSKIKDDPYGEYNDLFDSINPEFSQMGTDDLIIWHAKMALVCKYMNQRTYAEGHVSALFYLSLLRYRDKKRNGIGDEEFLEKPRIVDEIDLIRRQIIYHGQVIVEQKLAGEDGDANCWLKGLFDNTAILMGIEYSQGDKTFAFVLSK